MRLSHSRTQHSVGQGGLHSAVLDVDDTKFRYIYDCGSMNTDSLIRGIDQVCEDESPINMLFLSHLDEDHTNGLDRLLQQVDVDCVLLPYLLPFDRALLVVESLVRPIGTSSAISRLALLRNPAGWLRERGAKRVIFVRGRTSDDPAVEPPRDRDQKPLVPRLPEARSATESERSALGAGTGDCEVMPSGWISLSANHHDVWELAPYVHPEGLRPQQLRTAFAVALGIKNAAPESPRWLAALKKALRVDAKRSALAKLYNQHIRKDRNLTSMSLYSGPVNPVLSVSDASYRRFNADHHAIAWIGTGDMHLDVNVRREGFETFHEKKLPLVTTFALPHHGARRNMPTSFVSAHRGCTWVAAYGTQNPYKHPDTHLMQVAGTWGAAVRVTQHCRTEYRESFGVSF